MQIQVLNIANQNSPVGCLSKAIRYTAQLLSSVNDTLDLSAQTQNGTIDQIQSVYVDNSLNGSPITILCLETGHSLIVPAVSQAFLPVFCQFPATHVTFLFSSGGAVNVPLFFLNQPMPACVWQV